MDAPGQPGGTRIGAGNHGSKPSGQTDPTATGTSAASSSSISTSSSGIRKGAIIGGIVAGLTGLLIISLLGIWFLQRRKQHKNGAKGRNTRPVTYTGLNSVFRSVPFNRSSIQSHHNSLLPQPQASNDTNPSLSVVTLRGGGTSLGQREGGNETGYLPPSYAESQLSVSIVSLGPLNTAYRAYSDTNVSPLSSRDPNEAHTISPEMIRRSFMSSRRPSTVAEPIMISPQTTGPSILAGQFTGNSDVTHIISTQTPGTSILLPQHTRDSMRLPIERDYDTNTTAPIVAPVPRHPLVHQDSLERVVRQGLTPNESPVSNTNPNRFRVLSQEIPRESPVLGKMNPVRMMPHAVVNYNGLVRNDTQRTASSISTMAFDIISDEELERLGVGSRARYH